MVPGDPQHLTDDADRNRQQGSEAATALSSFSAACMHLNQLPGERGAGVDKRHERALQGV